MRGFSVTSDSIDAHDALMAAFGPDDVPACTADPDAWFERKAPEWVLDSCRSCPAAVACGLYATAAGEEWGTWAGVDEATRARRHRRRKPEDSTYST